MEITDEMKSMIDASDCLFLQVRGRFMRFSWSEDDICHIDWSGPTSRCRDLLRLLGMMAADKVHPMNYYEAAVLTSFIRKAWNAVSRQ